MAQQMMQSVFTGQREAQAASAIPRLAREEVIPLARVELDRFLLLVETLTLADLSQPTDCALWTVKDIIAHQASHIVSFTRLGEFIDQFNPLKLRAYTAKGINLLDAANQRQVDLRAAHSSAQLLAEMRNNREKSLEGRQRFPAPMRWLTIPVPGSHLRVNTGSLIDNVYTRDMWMHRADICRATGRTMTQTADHDGRIVALVVRELDAYLKPRLGGRSVMIQLTGMAGGAWTLGRGTAAALLTMETLEFNRLASGRITAQRALDEGLVTIEGDPALGMLALNNTVVLY